MKSIRKIIIFILLISNGKPNPPFNINEKLEFSVNFNSIPVGKAELNVNSREVINNKQTYLVSFLANTEGLADRLFKIRDSIELWIDEKEFYTHKVNKIINEGLYKKKTKITFNYDDSIAVINDNEKIKLPFRSWDPFSMFYYLRTIQLMNENILAFDYFNGKKKINYKLIVSGKEEIKSKIGSFNCYIVKPFHQGKSLLKNEGDMKIWISDSEKRLPIKIQIKMKFGSMKLDLLSIN